MADAATGQQGADRTLVVMRHARAATGGVHDRDRELTSAGVRDAQQAGSWLATNGVVPDLVLCSQATRTRQTAAAVRDGLLAADASVPPVVARDEIYHGGIDELMQVLAQTPATGGSRDVGTVMLIGHEPTMSALSAYLCGQGVSFPPAGMTVLTTRAPWPALGASTARLRHHRTP
ncbi:MAG: phosphohistidine phosphatase [Micrococcales bacterium]|nr:MAG: phosphohistidine phosphatase [Micrococcales bacterium]